MHRILLASIVFLAANTLAAEPSKDASGAVERAREAFSKKLEEANTDGIVLMKGESKRSTDQLELPLQLSAPAPTPTSTLRDGYEDAPDCLTLSGLTTAAASAGGDPFGRIDRLMGGLAGNAKAESNWNEARLAETYLAIGFFDEAYALSSMATGPRAAAISTFAAIAINQGSMPPEKLLESQHCGKLHVLAVKIRRAYGAGALNFDDADFQLIGSLPPPVAQSVFDYVSIAAIDRGELGIAARIREVRAGLDGVIVKTQAESFVDAALLISERSDVESAESLLTITADPGPLRERALNHLVTGNAAALLNDAQKNALYANLEDAHDASSESGWEAALADTLVNHKLKSGDWQGALRQLARQLADHENDNQKAKSTFSRVLSEKLLGEKKDDAISALAFVADNAEISAEGLGDVAFNKAVEELARLGAAEILEPLLAFRDSDASDHVLLRSDAMRRSGDIDGLKALVSGREGDVKFLQFIAAIALEDQKSALPKFSINVIQSPEAAESIARAAWAEGDWITAANFFRKAHENAPRDELLEYEALASLASGGVNEAAAGRRGGDAGIRNSVLMHMFVPAPEAGTDASLREFSQGVAQETEYIRKRNGL